MKTCLRMLLCLSVGTAAWGLSPSISSIVDAYTGTPGIVAPGQQILINGANLATSSQVCLDADQTGFLTTCGTTSVFMGANAAIQQISPTQLMVFVPYSDVQAGATLNVYVIVSNNSSAGFQVTVAAAVPSTIRFYKNGIQVVSQNPASPGDTVTAQTAGFGSTNPQPADGAIILNGPQYVAAGVIQVTVGGVPAPLTGPVTLQSINNFNVPFQVPNGLAGDQPVVFTVDGLASPPATLPLTGTPSGLSVTSASNLGTYSIGEVQVGLQASGGNGSYSWALQSGSLPPGLTIRPDLPGYVVPFAPVGLIGVAATPGTYNFTLRVTSGSASTTASFSMKIIGLTLKDGPTLPDAFAGVAYYQGGYQFTATADGATQPITCAPRTTAGLTLSGSCLLSGTPTTAGPLSIPVTFSNGNDTVTRSVSLTVYAVQITGSGQLPNATQSHSYTYTLTPAGSGPFTFAANGTLPTGLSLTGATISGTPTGALGKTNFNVTVEDSKNNFYTKAMSIDVVGTPETLPQIAPYANYADCTIGMGCSDGIAVSAGGTAPFTWTVTGLPKGMDFRFGSGNTLGFVNAGDLELWGAPNEIGNFFITVTATDSNGMTVSQVFPINVSDLLFDPCVDQAGCQPLGTGTLGAAYATSLRVVGGKPPYTNYVSGGYSITDELPAGLWCTPTAITGIPLESGQFTTALSFSDLTGYLLTVALPLQINGPSGSRTTIAVYPELYAVAGQPFSLQLSACCATGSYTWTPQFQSNGLSLSSSGLISGTPFGASTAFPVVKATDTADPNNYAARALVVDISSVSITTTRLPDATVSVAYNQALSGTGSGPLQWRMQVGSLLPYGLQLDSNTGAITGAPLYPGGYSFYVTANDSQSSIMKSISMSVYAPCDITKAGFTNIANVRQLLSEALGKQSAANDVNGDHKVNVVDIALGANAVLGLGCSIE